MRRWRGSGSARPRQRTRLTDEQVRQLREDYTKGRDADPPVSMSHLARAYGVHVTTVSKLVHGKNRRQAGGPIC